MKEVLSANNIKFAHVDITSGMGPLKKYLKIRDFSESHQSVRENGSVGIPTLYVDDKAYLIAGPEHVLSLIKELNLKDS